MLSFSLALVECRGSIQTASSGAVSVVMGHGMHFMIDSRPQNEELRVSTRLEGVSTWRDCHSQFRHR